MAARVLVFKPQRPPAARSKVQTSRLVRLAGRMNTEARNALLDVAEELTRSPKPTPRLAPPREHPFYARVAELTALEPNDGVLDFLTALVSGALQGLRESEVL